MGVRVALLEDDERFRRRLVRRLEFFAKVEVAFSAGSAEEFFELLDQQADEPEVALLDIGLPGASGIDVVDRLTREHPQMGALMLTVFEDPEQILAAIQAGASGYLLKDSPAERIVEAIVEVQRGGVPLSRPVARRVLGLLAGSEDQGAAGSREKVRRRADAQSTRPAAGDDDRSLTSREVELLEQIVRGGTEAEIAEHLSISPHTVRTHVKNIYRKLRVHSRAAAVRTAYERRLVEPDAG